MKDETIVLLTSIICITIIQVIAICELHIDGVLMSATIGTIVGLVLKRKEISEALRGFTNGRNKPVDRGSNRYSSTSN